MLRPRTVLWVDDEIETLDSQVLFLEQQGFTVERATNGDDALVLLRRQSYGVVLLDEQMPGTTGLDLIPHLRAIDAAMPVVMVTKSEETATMRDAIGAEIADYLIKPVNPRQVLTVVTRLLEGDRMPLGRPSRLRERRCTYVPGDRQAAGGVFSLNVRGFALMGPFLRAIGLAV